MSEQELVNGGVPVIYDDSLVEMAEKAERRIDAMKKIKTLSLKMTNAHDWTSQQDKPYLQVSGAEKVARLFGISWRIDEPIFTVEEDGHFSFTYKGYFSLNGAEIEAIGTRSSRDDFFSVRYRKDKDGKPEKYRRPPSEIDKGDVKKAAYTNCVGNGVTRILGIRNLTWDDLAEAGIRKEDVQSIDYKKQEMPEEVQNQRAEIERMLSEMCGGDKTKMGAALQKITTFPGKDGKEVKGKSKIEDLTEKAIPVVYEKVLKGYNEWKAGKANGSSGNNQ